MPERLSIIFSGLQQVMQQHHPTQAAVEQVFLARNPDSALKLGQARGAALVALTQHQLPISEYTARQVKQAVVGLGQATKEQVQHMVMRLLHLDRCPQADAADALAVAICHAHTQAGQARWLTGRLQGGSR